MTGGHNRLTGVQDGFSLIFSLRVVFSEHHAGTKLRLSGFLQAQEAFPRREPIL